jgi:hypothetical protein
VTRLLAIVGALLGVLLVPIALVGPTAWLVVPAHALFSLLVTVAAVIDGLSGRAERARVWGIGYMVASLATIGALQFGSTVEGRAYWVVPWVAMLAWGWAPPVVAGLAGWAGELVRAWRSDRSVQRRKREIPARS